MTDSRIVACPASPTGFISLQPYAAHYDPERITADDIAHDPAISVVDEPGPCRACNGSGEVDLVEFRDSPESIGYIEHRDGRRIPCDLCGKPSARLVRAAERVEATDLGDGRWAYYAAETSRWHVVSAADLADLCDYLDATDPAVAGDAYSHWCAGTPSEEMPRWWTPDAQVTPHYTIFDADPGVSGVTAWPTHTDVEIEDVDSAEEAVSAVRDVLESEAAGLSPADGYTVGQRIFALVWLPDGSSTKVSCELTAEDLGVEEDEQVRP